jgi:hypothetical protein
MTKKKRGRTKKEKEVTFLRKNRETETQRMDRTRKGCNG